MDCGDSLEHGNQEDHHSCLVCCANTMAHAVFDDTLWHMDSAALEKVNWFRTLSKQGPEVNTSHLIIRILPIIFHSR